MLIRSTIVALAGNYLSPKITHKAKINTWKA